MKTALSVAGIVCLLAVAFAALWVASAIDRFLTEARGLVEDTRKQEVAKHAKNLILSAHGMTFDIRQEYTDNAKFNSDAKLALASGIDKAGKSLERSALAIERLSVSASDSFHRISTTAEALRGDLAPPAISLLAETKTAVMSTQDDLRRVSLSVEKSVAQAGDGGERALDQAASVLEQTAGAVSDGRPIIRSGARIADSAANIAAHYEREWTKGTAWSRIKYFLKAVIVPLTIRVWP